jgi:hypothetical protein
VGGVGAYEQAPPLHVPGDWSHVGALVQSELVQQLPVGMHALPHSF